MTELDYLSAIRFAGADAVEFLHNQLSSDVLDLAKGESVFACYCEPKGRVLALMLVYRSDESYCTVMARSLARAVVDRMRMYVLRSKVEIEVLNQYAVVGLEGEPALQISHPTANIPVPGADQSLLLVDRDAEDTPNDDAVSDWKANELRQGITWLGPETSGQFLPQMLGFDQIGAVNFKKGCYPGQEIVARTHYLGKLKRHPRLLIIDAGSCPKAMEKLELAGDGQTFDAVAVDCAEKDQASVLQFVVTRMPPDIKLDQLKYQGRLIKVQAAD
jgi:folate-binding protein YgfZ